MEYIFNKIDTILNNYIMYFQLYESYRIQLNNMLNPSVPVNIDIQIVSSDCSDDINFILSPN